MSRYPAWFELSFGVYFRPVLTSQLSIVRWLSGSIYGEREKVGSNEVELEGAFHYESLGCVINIAHADLG